MNEISRIEQADVDRFRTAFSYDPQTGHFTRRVAMGRHGCFRAGTAAGTITHNGYVSICFVGKRYYAHRIAWLVTHSEWPNLQIDHRDGNRANNAIANLRLATIQQNARNSCSKTKRADGLKGIYLHKASGLWAATIKVAQGKISLGYHKTPEAAHAAYAAAARLHHGDFARIA